MNRAINTLVLATVDSLKKFKNLFANYFAIFALGFSATIIGTMDDADAASTTLTTTSIISTGNISDAEANDIILAPTDTIAAVQTLTHNVASVTDIIMGKDDTVIQTVTLKVAPGAAGITIASHIVGVGDGSNDSDVTKLTVQSSAAGSSQLVTFSGKIGPGPIDSDGNVLASTGENDIDAIEIGSATEAGTALFNNEVTATALTIFGGNATGEDGVATFAKDLNTATILLQDSATNSATIKFSSASAVDILGTINGGDDDEGIMQVTGTDITYNGVIGGIKNIGTLDIDNSVIFNAAVSAKTVTVAAGKTAQFDLALSATDITLASTGTLKIIGNSIIAGAVTGGTINSTTAESTFSGAVGTALLKTAIDADFGTNFGGVVNATTVLIADAKVVDFDAAVTATSITLGSSTAGGTASFTGAAAKTITTDFVSFGTDKKGTIVSNGTETNGVIFAGDIGTAAASIALITGTDDTTLNGTVYAESITLANAKDLHFKGDVEIGVTDITLTGATADLHLTGTVAQTITGTAAGAIIKGGGAGNGLIKVTNAAGAKIDVIAGVNGAELVSLTTSGTGHVILGKAGNEINDLIIGNNTVFELSTDVGTGTDVITTTSVGDTWNAGSTILMPSNLANGSTITFIANDNNTNVDEIAEDITVALRDSALVDYTVAVAIGDLNITATDKSSATIATALGTTTNAASGLLQARNAMIGTAADLAVINNVLNAQGGFSATEDTAFANQVSPQSDTIGGSTVATRAMTGTVQGIVSNRMASLRSGDAFVTGMSAGNGMSANSGFIQAFGSEGEQKNTTKSGATTFGFDTETSGLAVGFDGMTDSGSTIGLSASYSATDVDGKGTGKSKNSIDSYTVSVYADKATDIGYVEGSLTYGINDNVASRVVNTAGLNRAYTSNYDSEQVSLKVGGGVPNEVADNAFVTPFASSTATIISTDAYTEKSALVNDNLRLKIEQDDVNSLVGSLGVKAHMVTDMGTPMISLAVNNEFGDTSINSANTYTGGGTKFQTKTDVEELSATLGLGYSFGNDVTSLNINYEANVNDDEYLNQYGSIKIVAKF